MRRGRSGWLLLQVAGGLFVGALVLAVCVPLFVAAQEHAEARVRQARIHATARELSARICQDARSAARVEAAGGALTLTLPRAGGADMVVYRQTPAGLLRELRPSGIASPPAPLHPSKRTAGDVAVLRMDSRSRPPERFVYGEPLRSVRFGRDGAAVTARLEFIESRKGRERSVTFDCSATPRSAL